MKRALAWLGNPRYELRSVIGCYPGLFFPLSQLKPSIRSILTAAGTEIVIEGFARSGNTFSSVAFELAQGRQVRIARHRHVPAQVMRGVQLGLPVLVLIRNPRDAVLSLIIRHPQISPAQALRDYHRFYRRIWPYRREIVLGRFEEITSDFGVLIERINQRYQTDFTPFENNPENIERCFARIEEMDQQDTGRQQVSESMVARPSASRGALKAAHAAQLEEPALQGLLQRANQIYQALLADLAQTDSEAVA